MRVPPVYGLWRPTGPPQRIGQTDQVLLSSAMRSTTPLVSWAVMVLSVALVSGCRRDDTQAQSDGPRSSHDAPAPPGHDPSDPSDPSDRELGHETDDDPTVFLRGPERIWEFGEHVVWRDWDADFWFAPRESVDDRVRTPIEGADALAWDGTFVYWLGSGAEAVQRLQLRRGAEPQTIAQGDRYAYNIRTDGARVYWLTSSDDWQVRSAPVEGGALVTHREGQLQPPLRVGADHVYWLRSFSRGGWTVRALERAPTAGGPVEEVALAHVEHGTSDYDVVDGEIIYVGESPRRLFAIPERGGEARELHSLRAEFDLLRVVDGTALYLSHVPGSTQLGMGIFALTLDGEGESSPQLFGTMLGWQEEGFHVGERELYWPARSQTSTSTTIHRRRWR